MDLQALLCNYKGKCQKVLKIKVFTYGSGKGKGKGLKYIESLFDDGYYY